MRIVIDIDGTICETNGNDYHNARYIPSRIANINKMWLDGHYIVLFSGRGSLSGKDYYELTKKQLDTVGIKYDELHLGKIPYDIWVDDKSRPPSWLDNEDE